MCGKSEKHELISGTQITHGLSDVRQGCSLASLTVHHFYWCSINILVRHLPVMSPKVGPRSTFTSYTMTVL